MPEIASHQTVSLTCESHSEKNLVIWIWKALRKRARCHELSIGFELSQQGFDLGLAKREGRP